MLRLLEHCECGVAHAAAQTHDSSSNWNYDEGSRQGVLLTRFGSGAPVAAATGLTPNSSTAAPRMNDVDKLRSFVGAPPANRSTVRLTSDVKLRAAFQARSHGAACRLPRLTTIRRERTANGMTPLRYCSAEPLQRRAKCGGLPA
jgi:hypothetical protein